MGKPANDDLSHDLCAKAGAKYRIKVRVGGGIRSVARAVTITKWGAAQIIIGSAAVNAGKVNARFLGQLVKKINPSQVVVALDTEKGRIVTNGWRRRLKLRPETVMAQLQPFCAAFLCTDVDREGTMSGANLEWFRKLRDATSHPIIAAGGIKTRREITALEKIGMDAAVGMAVYKNRLR
jgi:phosphoribosylformimino-5-aminoimidazole carboxamide ribonucleotide (ProFAR) isomerase